MRKDIKKRLEKALITLQEPGGSTIRSIIKVINKDSPILSLRKVLEALQEGINEGFLCMYNGRFKLKQQIYSGRAAYRDRDVFEENDVEEKDREEDPKTSESELLDEESDFESDEDNANEYVNEALNRNNLALKKSAATRTKTGKGVKNGQGHSSKKTPAKKKNTRFLTKNLCTQKKKKTRSQLKKMHACSKDVDKIGCDSILEITSDPAEKSLSNRQTTEKPDVKKQRGPRCTSMKKDIRMPSKVHIPFMPPAVPQRSTTYNELLRRSPEPVNGPLFDNGFLTQPKTLGFFGIHC